MLLGGEEVRRQLAGLKESFPKRDELKD